MKTQILDLLANGSKLTTNEIAAALGTLNRVAYKHLCDLASKSELRRISPENGSFGVPASWVIFK